jgi:predicted MFS family arabinose efflux permease
VPLVVLMVVLFFAGLFISPNLIAAQGLVDQLAPAHRLGEAQAWLSTAITAGAALGNAAAGLILDAAGPREALTTASCAVLAAALVCLAAQRVWGRRPVAVAP